MLFPCCTYPGIDSSLSCCLDCTGSDKDYFAGAFDSGDIELGGVLLIEDGLGVDLADLYS